MTCRSSPANPPPKLTWFIAGQQVSVNYHHHNHQHRHHNHHNNHHQQADMLYFWSTVHHHHLSKCPFHLFEKPDTAYETMFTKAQPQYPINISPDEQTNKCKGANLSVTEEKSSAHKVMRHISIKQFCGKKYRTFTFRFILLIIKVVAVGEGVEDLLQHHHSHYHHPHHH